MSKIQLRAPFIPRWMDPSRTKVETSSTCLADRITTLPLESIDQLIQAGCDLNAQDRYGNTALHNALQRRDSINWVAIRTLLQADADPNIFNQDEETPLHIAMRLRNYRAIVELTNSKQLDIQQLSSNGQSLLHAAAYRQVDEVIKRIAYRGAEIDLQDSKLRTPLCIAVRCKNYRAAAELLRLGADPRIEDYRGNSPLIYALLRENDTLTKQLLDHGANPNSAFKREASLLHYALKRLKEEQSIRAKTEYENGWILSSRKKQKYNSKWHRITKALIEAGADCNRADENGDSPLHLCGRICDGKSEIWKLLNEHGAQTECKNSQECPPSFDFNHAKIRLAKSEATTALIASCFIIPAPLTLPYALVNLGYLFRARQERKTGNRRLLKAKCRMTESVGERIRHAVLEPELKNLREGIKPKRSKTSHGSTG